MNGRSPIVVSEHASIRARGRFPGWPINVAACNQRIRQEIGDAVREGRVGKRAPTGTANRSSRRVKGRARIAYTVCKRRGYVICERRRPSDPEPVIVVITSLNLTLLTDLEAAA